MNGWFRCRRRFRSVDSSRFVVPYSLFQFECSVIFVRPLCLSRSRLRVRRKDYVNCQGEPPLSLEICIALGPERFYTSWHNKFFSTLFLRSAAFVRLRLKFNTVVFLILYTGNLGKGCLRCKLVEWHDFSHLPLPSRFLGPLGFRLSAIPKTRCGLSWLWNLKKFLLLYADNRKGDPCCETHYRMSAGLLRSSGMSNFPRHVATTTLLRWYRKSNEDK